jgi:tetratricopeptide (TPR) repeat protein
MQRLLILAALAVGALRADTVLVLPFFNHAASANLDWIGESIAESVGDSLASEGLLVLDRADRLEAYRRMAVRPGAELTHATIIKAAEALDATRVVYGSYELLPAEPGKQSSKGSLRITARIMNLKRMRQTAEFSEVGALEDLGALEVHLAWQALSSLRTQAPAEVEFVQARPPIRLDASESYIRGLLAASPEQRYRFFTQAARLDAHYSQPCFQLGRISWQRKDYRVAAGWFERVTQKDQHFLEARFFLGLSKFHGGDFAAAEQAFEQVAAAVPLNEVFNNLAVVQARRSNSAGAIANLQKALEGDSADPDYYFNLGLVQWRAGQHEAATASFREVLVRNPADEEASALLARSERGEGPRPAEARERIKTNYDEAAYRQLQAELAK